MKITIKHYIWVLGALLCVACNGVNRQQAYAVAKMLVEAGAESKVEAENECTKNGKEARPRHRLW